MTLEDRVTHLEKIVVILAKWTKLNVKHLSPLEDVIQDENEDANMFHDGEWDPRPKSIRRQMFKSKIKITKKLKLVTKKSTCDGMSKNLATKKLTMKSEIRNREELTTNKDGDHDVNEDFSGFLTPTLRLVMSKDDNNISTVESPSFIKVEKDEENARGANNMEKNYGGVIFPEYYKIQDEDASLGYSDGYDDCEYSSDAKDFYELGREITGSSSNDDEDEIPTSQALSRRSPRTKRRRMPTYDEYEPLKLAESFELPNQGPLIKMDKLNPSVLERMNVSIPKIRRNRLTFSCRRCPDTIFKKRSELFEHLLKEHNEGPSLGYTCDECENSDERFPTLKKMEKHRKLNHKRPKEKKKPPERVCPHCQKIFTHKQHYLNHVRVHTGERPYLCYICGFATKNTQCLKLHIKLRHEDPEHRPFKCEICGSGFKISGMLKSHMNKIHNPDKTVYPCEICNGTFTDSTKLKRHINDVHCDKRSLLCPICGQTFKRPDHLKRHVLNHDNPNRRQRRSQQKPLMKWTIVGSSQNQNQVTTTTTTTGTGEEGNKIDVEEVQDLENVDDENMFENQDDENQEHEEDGDQDITDNVTIQVYAPFN